MRLYLDTSIIGAFLDQEPADYPKITARLFAEIRSGRHQGSISEVTLEEIERAAPSLRRRLLRIVQSLSPEILHEDEESARLLEAYEAEGIIRQAARIDFTHIAIATVNHVDVWVSWNFRDIVNIRTKRGIQMVNLRLGYPVIEILSPREVVEYG